MKTLTLLLALLLAPASSLAQGVFSPPQTALKTINGLLMPIANATITVCAANAGGMPCTPPLLSTIFKDSALSQPLSNPFTADANGNYQFAAAAATYTVTVTAAGFAGYSYQVSLGGTGGGVISGFGLDATTFPGADPCLQIQAALYTGLPSSGGIVNATRFTSFSSCSVNPFQTPLQTNPAVFTSLPASGVLFLPNLSLVVDVPFYVPNKWSLQGVPGYGPFPGKTQIQPSTNFVANRPQISATGGASGCSASGGSTVTISGTTLPAAANLLGMWVFCSSNASSTAVPDSTNAQIGGAIIAVSGNVLTLSGAGASGTVTNTGWSITPVVAGWAPGPQGYAVMGSGIRDLTISCQTPSVTYANNGIGWLDVTGQEMSYLANDSVLYCNNMQIAVFTAGAQNGGPFSNLTLNTKGQGTNSSILIQLFGTGFNAAGGGGTGLCGPANPCAGSSTRDWTGLTLLMDGSGIGTGGTGIDVSGFNIKIGDGISHCEGCNTVVRIGSSGAAQAIAVEGMAGCTSSGCADTSIVDISANYGSVGAPGPTQNISFKRISRSFASTWDFRDFINLVGDINDSTVGAYSIGAAGSSNSTIWTDTQPLSCISTGGAADANGAHCKPTSQIDVISKLGGEYYAVGYNGNGPVDKCQQISNAMQIAFTDGLTEGAVFKATGFTNRFGNPCGVSPWASGTYPASGRLELPASTLFLSLPWSVPANWMVTGQGGNGIGIGGGTGSNLSPNIGNTVNANYANDTVAGTISCTAGNYTCTGAGSNFTSLNLNHFLLACAALPCTNQALMVGGLITTVGSTTSITLNSPAQTNLAGAAYTITAPLITNNGVLRDLGVDSNSFGTGGGNGNGAFVGLLQSGLTGSYVENFSAGHVNAVGIAAIGLNSGAMLRGPIQVNASALGTSIFMCVDAPQGVSIMDGLTCQSNTLTNPTLSYGVLAGGSGFEMHNLSFQNVNIGLELLVHSSYVTNGINISGLFGGPGTAAVTTLLDMGGITGANTAPFAANISNLVCGGCTTTVNDHLQTLSLTDGMLGWYNLGKQISGCRNFAADSHTIGNISNSCGTSSYGAAVAFAGLAACAAGNKFTIAAITDSTTITWGATITGGGANPVIGMCDGTNWTVVGK